MTEIKPAMAQFPLEAPSPLTVAKKLAKAINGMVCPVCGGNDFKLKPFVVFDNYQIACEKCGRVFMFDLPTVNAIEIDESDPDITVVHKGGEA